jgi:hypothetical protein
MTHMTNTTHLTTLCLFMEDFKNITDPLGNKIQLTNNLCTSNGDAFDIRQIYDDVVSVIVKPDFIISVHDDKKRQYYFRLLRPGDSLLIGAIKMQHHWYAFECTKNPDVGYIKSLYLKGVQVYS